MNELLKNKYNIHIINKKRYYEFDMISPLTFLNKTAPYYFRYKNIEMYSSSLYEMASEIFRVLDSMSLKTDKFTRTKRIVCSSFENLISIYKSYMGGCLHE